jgi:hypothetical protein
MLEANSQTLTVTTNTNITFANKNLQTGVTAVLGNDNATVSLNRAGIYRVDFTAYGASTAEGTIGAQLYANGNAVNRASSVATTAAGAPQSISFAALVAVGNTVQGQTATINVRYTGSAGILNNANLIVTKIA